MNLKDFMKFFKPYFWRSVFTTLGFATAILFLAIGFWKTAVILLCCGIGYAIGLLHDKNINPVSLILRWRDKW